MLSTFGNLLILGILSQNPEIHIYIHIRQSLNRIDNLDRAAITAKCRKLLETSDNRQKVKADLKIFISTMLHINAPLLDAEDAFIDNLIDEEIKKRKLSVGHL